jgi:hypothetical protein
MIILPKYIVVKNIRSAVNMLARCSFGPFIIPKLPIKVREPQVKERADFWGFNAIIGRPTKNANEKKRADRNKSAQKTCRERTGFMNFESWFCPSPLPHQFLSAVLVGSP